MVVVVAAVVVVAVVVVVMMIDLLLLYVIVVEVKANMLTIIGNITATGNPVTIILNQ